MGSDCDTAEVILGVDGGTTSTVCVCMPLLRFSDHHRLPDPLPILGRAVAGCSNHNSVGENAAKDTLEKVMFEALSKSGSKMSAVQAVCLGVSGVNHPNDQEKILNWMRGIFPSHVKIYVHNDAVAALASGTMGKLNGCVLIAGTGCISYGFTEDGRQARSAGAGPVLGDWGSGYGIAAQALTAVMRAYDGRGEQTLLTSRILDSLGLSSPDEVIGWTYADPSWARIAALVPVVVSCAEAGDQIADGILKRAVEELALSVKAVIRRLRLAGEGQHEAVPMAHQLLDHVNGSTSAPPRLLRHCNGGYTPWFTIWNLVDQHFKMCLFGSIRPQMGMGLSLLCWLVVSLKRTRGGILGDKSLCLFYRLILVLVQLHQRWSLP